MIHYGWETGTQRNRVLHYSIGCGFAEETFRIKGLIAHSDPSFASVSQYHYHKGTNFSGVKLSCFGGNGVNA